MSAGTHSPGMRLVAEERQPRAVSNGVLGMCLFIISEIMFFAGMVSAFTIIRASAPIWPPPDQPRLPIEATAFNSAVLLLSGALVILAQRRFSRDRSTARVPLIAAIALATFFVAFQGWEWVSLLSQGLTMTSSTLGAFFYLIVGTHALHALAAIGMLFSVWRRFERGWLQPSQLATAAVFWYFVVGAWPVIYWRVYL